LRMKVLDYFLTLLFCSFVYTLPLPTWKSAEIYSGQNSIAINPDVHVYQLNLTCFSGVRGDYVINIDQPNFQSKIAGVYFFLSQGPSKGRYAPFPDPADNTTYQWTTKHGSDAPKPGVIIKNGRGQVYYATLNCPAGRDCDYTLVTEYNLSSSKKTIEGKSHAARTNPINFLPARALQVNETGVGTVTMPPLFYSNTMETDGSVNYNEWSQYQVPLCQSALYGRFKNDPICLAFTVVGLGPDFIFYQQVSQDPPPKQGVTKWKTRDTDPNPYLDYSGVSTLPVNRWISQPVLVKELPAFLYHSILGQGGKGLDPPFINHFVVTYEYGKCPVD